jgi:uncharacterized SAM-binding protein YcdF (DUF218 family)
MTKGWIRYSIVPVVLVTGCVILFFLMPLLLIAPSVTEPSDAILHLAINPHSESDAYIADLYREKFSKKIVCVSSQITWETYPADYARQHLISLGVPAEDVLTLRLPITDCQAVSMSQIVSYVANQGWSNVLLVSNPENSRYSGWLARRAFEKRKISAAVTYSPADRMELTSDWWRTHWKVQRLTDQVMNILFDVLFPDCR